MRKLPIFLACILLVMWIAPVAGAATAVIGGADGPTAIAVAEEEPQDDLGGTEPAPDETNPDDTADDTEMVESSDEESLRPTPSPSPVPTAPPVDNHDFTIEAVMGYDGLIFMNRWTPMFVTVTNHGADFDGMLGVNVFTSQTEYDRYEIPLTLAGSATKRVVLPVQPQLRQDMYAFELTVQGKILAELRAAPSRLIAPESIGIGVLSAEPEKLAYLNQRANSLDTLRGEVWLTIPLDTETFPDTLELMQSFSVLVVDGVDIRTLSDTQQQVLTAWLLKGGFVLVSGGAKAADGYPFFTEWTQASASTLYTAEDITPGLLEYATLKGIPVEETLWMNELPLGNTLIKASDSQSALTVTRAGSGLIYLCAFDMGDKALTTWSSMTSVWPRIFRQSASAEYLLMVNHAENARYGGNDSYRARSLVDNLTVDNNESGIPVLLILAAYLVVVGFGGYLLLKKLDKREWLWITAPLAAVIFALLIALLSQSSTMNDPVTLTASRVLIDGQNAQTNTYVGVATPHDGEMIIETDQEQMPKVVRSDEYWYDESPSGDRLYRPLNLRQRYRFGAEPAVGFSTGEAWDVKMLVLSGLRSQVGTVDASVWMQQDGLHGEAVNNTDYLLHDCMVVSSFGYSILGDILPGEKLTFQMLYPKEKYDMSDPSFTYKPDIMYSTLDIDLSASTNYYYDNNVYNYINAALYGSGPDAAYGDPVAERRYSLIQLFDDEWGFYQNRDTFYLFGYNDSLGRVAISLNGEPVTRTGHTAVVGARIPYDPIGPTGQVMFPQGYIKPEIMVDQGDDSKPRPATEEDGESDGNNTYGVMSDTYLSLGSPTSLRFVLPEHTTYSIERMALTGQSYESLPNMFLYNNETEAWDAQLLLSISMEGEDWAPYIDDEGAIYVRYVPAETSGRYEGMNAPSIALKGEVK